MKIPRTPLAYLGVAMMAGSIWMACNNLSDSPDEKTPAESTHRRPLQSSARNAGTERPGLANRAATRPSTSAGALSGLPDDALQRILNQERPEHDADLANVIRERVAWDAAATADFAWRMERPELKEVVMRILMQAWARRDPAAALSWASELADAQAAQAAMVHVCAEVSEADPELAMSLAGEHSLDQNADGLAGNLVTRWAVKDLSAARDWVRQQPAGNGRDELISRIAFVHSKTDPAAAAQMVADEVPPGMRQTEAAISVVHQWGLKDLQAATEWVSLFPEGSLRERALRELEGINRYRQDQISR